MKKPGPAALLLVMLLLHGGCSIKRLAINSMADTLAASGDVFASDDDPELIRDAAPFSLKTMEALLAEVPRHEGLLLASCRGFTQYSYAFVQADADLIEAADFEAATRLRERALRLYLRARDYGLRALEVKHSGTGERLRTQPETALTGATAVEVPVLYWAGAAWGSAISLGKDKPELIADLPAVRRLMNRALALDEDYDRGALHEVMILLEAVPEAMGGSVERARRHFARAVELSGGLSASPYVTLASSVSVMTQNRVEFERLLKDALAVDPNKAKSLRLANLITQRRARSLLNRIDELFVDSTS